MQKSNIDDIVTEVSDILLTSAKSTFGFKNIRNCTNKSTKQWYNADCKKAKHNFRKAKSDFINITVHTYLNRDPKIYKPITLLSCIGKILTSILNDRLNVYFEQFKILNENQAGFRHGYSSTDHMFSLHTLFELLCVKKKKLHCAFIDFEKALDFV
jgi:hypothetical protein